ncbi:hypothetical protein [Roseospira visakhapatnamensis]|uniref:Uncharacterized protein n=1 Tax=Roseospira visakhapatnamensis TaxID=390880 RepID=A0A7W6RCZ1_9PROT|nr:hypothetical protein [Roseospira visakhapatnamensis]MBB4266289.1 hypothetical protein [Roseospira visakhapatnamensis]
MAVAPTRLPRGSYGDPMPRAPGPQGLRFITANPALEGYRRQEQAQQRRDVLARAEQAHDRAEGLRRITAEAAQARAGGAAPTWRRDYQQALAEGGHGREAMAAADATDTAEIKILEMAASGSPDRALHLARAQGIPVTPQMERMIRTPSVAGVMAEAAKIPGADKDPEWTRAYASARLNGLAPTQALERAGSVGNAATRFLDGFDPARYGLPGGTPGGASPGAPGAPGETPSALPSLRDGLRATESGGNPAALRSDTKSAGLYQHTPARLQDLGVYSGDGAWNGGFTIPGFPKVRTLADYLANPDAQEAVQTLHETDILRQIDTLGLGQYRGQTVGGVPINDNALVTMAHLGGMGGLRKFLETDGRYNPADANGTRLSDFGLKFGRGFQPLSAAAMLPALPPDTGPAPPQQQQQPAPQQQQPGGRTLTRQQLDLLRARARTDPEGAMKALWDTLGPPEAKPLRPVTMAGPDGAPVLGTFDPATGAYTPSTTPAPTSAARETDLLRQAQDAARKEADATVSRDPLGNVEDPDGWRRIYDAAFDAQMRLRGLDPEAARARMGPSALSTEVLPVPGDVSDLEALDDDAILRGAGLR